MPLTTQQFERRKKGIGSSDLSAIVGTSPYTTWQEKWEEKALGKRKERDDKLDDLAHWGDVMEPVIADEYARRVRGRGWIVEPHDTLVHPEIAWAVANPDRLVYCSTPVAVDPGKPGPQLIARERLIHGLEIKNRDKNDKPRWAENHVPAEVATQAYWGMFVSGLPRWDVAALIGGNDLRVVTLLRDDELLDAMKRVGEVFWAGVEAKQLPEMEWVEGEREFIQRHLVNDADLAAFNRAEYWRKRKGKNVA
jgi:putative phage-type endonuclease